jgi:hypothetical protein
MQYEISGVPHWRCPIPKVVGVSLSVFDGRCLVMADALSSCLGDMRTLVEKFPEGYEGWARKRGKIEPICKSP